MIAWLKRLHERFPMTRGAAYSVVFLFLLTLVLTIGSYALSVQAIHRSQANTATIAQLCITGNQFRRQQIVLWTHIIHVSVPPPHETAAERQQRLAVTRAFVVYLHRVFASRNCQTLGH